MVAHGIQFEDVRLPGELAPIPAWYVPGERDTCLIFVHGKSSWRGEALRLMPVGRSLGLPMLAITYRGCEDVPADSAETWAVGLATGSVRVAAAVALNVLRERFPTLAKDVPAG